MNNHESEWTSLRDEGMHKVMKKDVISSTHLSEVFRDIGDRRLRSCSCRCNRCHEQQYQNPKHLFKSYFNYYVILINIYSHEIYFMIIFMLIIIIIIIKQSDIQYIEVLDMSGIQHTVSPRCIHFLCSKKFLDST